MDRVFGYHIATQKPLQVSSVLTENTNILSKSPKSLSMVQSPGECIRIIHNTEGSVDYGGVQFVSVRFTSRVTLLG